MPFYSVVIGGTNFPARVFDGAEGPVGFFVTRFVEATDEKAAEFAVVELIKDELRPLLVEQQTGEANPAMFLDQISEIEDMPENAPGSGFTWFPMINRCGLSP